MYTIDTTDPITGAGQDPDNNFAITSWGQDPPGHDGSFAFGTDLEIIDGGGHQGGNVNDRHGQDGNPGIHIPETEVQETSTIRFEVCQSADHEDFSLYNIELFIWTELYDVSLLPDEPPGWVGCYQDCGGLEDFMGGGAMSRVCDDQQTNVQTVQQTKRSQLILN